MECPQTYREAWLLTRLIFTASITPIEKLKEIGDRGILDQ